MKKILGLDIGTNSIGGAFIEMDTENYGKQGEIIWTGSRIVPVDGDALQKFESGGQVETKAASRRQKRGSRRLKHRYKLRRTRLIETLKILGWLPNNFPTDFKTAKKDGIEFKMKDYLPFSETTLNEAGKAFKIERNKKGKINVPEDWVVYYLRKKALTQKIELPELARILYMLNQRRGFKSSRKDLQDETSIIPYDEYKEMTDNGKYVDTEGKTLETKFVEFTKIKAVEWIEDEGQDKKGNYTYKIYPESDRMKPWTEKRKKKPEWEGKEFRFLVTQKTKKSGKEYKTDQLKPQIPGDDDWNLAMVSLDEEIEVSGKQVGEFFFDKLVENKNYRIRQQVVKRERYQKELKAIWKKQGEFHPELKSKAKLEEIAGKLYPLQTEQKLAKWKEITNGSLLNVISKDIIYYQRDLKSQKNLIDECRYEKKPTYTNKKGEQITPGYKVAPKSCPEFQEFRIWQDIHNMRLVLLEDETSGKINIDQSYLLTHEKKAELFELFDRQEEVKQNQLLKKIDKSFSEKTHRISLFANRSSLKGNETKALLRKVFKKYEFDGEHLLNDKDKFQLLWHILYSITGKDHEKGIRKALTNPKNGFNMPEDVVEHLAIKTKEFPSQYAAFSRKAIKKLLPLMQCGGYWSEANFNQELIERINKFIDGEYDENIDDKTRERIDKLGLNEITKYQGLPVWLACYIVYGRHSERESNEKLKSIEDFENHIRKNLPQNSLRNPIVEQVIRETMQVVKDVWQTYGRPDEIHIEMGRDLKNSTDERDKISKNQTKNFNDKQRVKKLLQELRQGNPESPIDIDKFRIWKEQAGKEGKEKFDSLFNNKNEFVSNVDIEKYRLWAEQKHKSPYTGETIPLSKLFTEEYEKEHIIPRSRLKYDAMTNLVICERAVNGFKSNRLAMEMIEEDGGREHVYKGVNFKLLSKDAYLQNCKTFDFRKRKNLLTDEVPEDFIERQINDTRHITRRLGELLWPVAKDKEGLIYTIGSITDDLKNQWGIKTEWKKLIRPRFERLGKILNEELIEVDGNKFHLKKPDDKVDLKRIDHRHHAMDALVIAATTRAHINYLNALSSHEKKMKWKYVAKERVRDFHLPWPTFAKDAKDKLSEVIISHKYNNRVLRTPHNRYWKWEQQADGSWKKVLKKQQPNERWKSVKKSLFKEPSGYVYLKNTSKTVSIDKAIEIQLERQKGIKDETGKPRAYIYDKHARKLIKELCNGYGVNDVKELQKEAKNLKGKNGEPLMQVRIATFEKKYAKRPTKSNINKELTYKKILKIPNAKKIIERCEQRYKGDTDFAKSPASWPIAFLLKKHLDAYGGKPAEAFESEGLEELTKMNGGKPIKKITTAKTMGNPIEMYGKIFTVDEGCNVYFVIYEDKNGKRKYAIPQILDVIERKINHLPVFDEKPDCKTFVLKVGDLVYVPTPEELEHPHHIQKIKWNGEDKKSVFERIYIVRKFTGTSCYFLPHNVATLIKNYDKDLGKGEFGSQNLSEKTIDGVTTIKEYCIPIEVDRLGNIVKVDGREITPTGRVEKM